MEKFYLCKELVAPLDRANVDTDAIIPKQFLKSTQRSGFGKNLFDEWRFLDYGELGMRADQRRLNPDFILNQSRYHDARILLARANFGCGSSREHAPWALQDYGFKVIIAPSFADIFFNNCFKIGLLPIVLNAAVVDRIFYEVSLTNGYYLVINLEDQTVTAPDGESYSFEIDLFRKNSLLNGLDEIELTLQHIEKIKVFEEEWRMKQPWLFL
ncbi:3-isopropylmalate dehydratase small subunit [Nitrosomonadaceae bacterium]|nr:3-isopropylmalate dehydratase small subunit [Nitrosospira sp.]MDW7643069.1 3-isopropylmalate dehydratase small subunit [Nitrosomonadaceae bacterium]MDW7652671.1 3-isopropylmalate dehydratase small subunit [Nitrosomonadaceae bacterium]MDW7664363.1 3-isopropylmalate dehydratase small subunit [Nitrosomonadaceae bacterium]MDW7665174.1 3-isopropylmalate dehydratase small subunit [Nitrosomonadaceae bacterium]